MDFTWSVSLKLRLCKAPLIIESHRLFFFFGGGVDSFVLILKNSVENWIYVNEPIYRIRGLQLRSETEGHTGTKKG